MTPNQKAILDMIAYSEIGPELLAASDNGYDVMVGSTAKHPILFKSYANHPHIVNPEFKSSAAGRYQLLLRYYDSYKISMRLHDFKPATQDAIALQQIKECKAFDDIEAGRFNYVIAKIAHLWASLPGADYPGQHMNKLAELQAAYVKAGGTVS